MPFLEILFDKNKLVKAAPEFGFNKANFDYLMSQMIVDYGDRGALLFICVLVAAMVAFKNIFRYLALYFMVSLRINAIRDIRESLYSKILRLPLSYFSDEKRGDLITRMSADVQEIEVSIMSSLEAIFKEPLTILVFLIALITTSPQLTLLALLTLAATAVVVGLIGRTLRQQSGRSQDKLGQMVSLFEETLSGIRIIKGFNAEAFFTRKFFNENKLFARLYMALNRRRDASSPVSETMSILGMLVILWFGGNMVLGSDGLAAEEFIFYLAIFSQIVSPAKAFSTAYYNVQKGVASIERIEHIMENDEVIIERPNALELEEFKNSIEFRSVTFSYDKEPVLSEINLSIPRGSTIALVGPSGGGKSTLADLIPRFYDPVSGAVEIDGTDIREFKITELRKQMGIVTQESILFNDSVYNNIAFGNLDVSAADIEKAARIANAHEFIMDLEKGYQTNIGDRGNKLSGGQRQRLSIARAVLRDPAILILDEATSALDTSSEKLVQEALNNVKKGRTAIVIAHRLSTIQNADLIVVLDKGRIIQKGTHEELINQMGLYQTLSRMQSTTNIE